MSYSVVMDVAVALAVSALLVEAYGMVRRKLTDAALTPYVLGVLFGVIAMVQMHSPIEPFDGLILDLRNIPVALAGAFLGWRGLLPCLAIAAATRLGIGGVGAMSGVVAMTIAGTAGIIWRHQMSRHEHRDFSMFLLLALLMSTHLVAAFVLPHEMAVWFITTAAAPFLALNLFAIPLIGALLERENRRIKKENRLSAAITRDPESGLLTGSAFVRDVTNAYAAQPFGTFAGFLLVKTDKGVWQSVTDILAGGAKVPLDHHFLANHFEHAALTALCANGNILIPLSASEVKAVDAIKSELRQSMRSDYANAGRKGPVTLKMIAAPAPEDFLRVANTAAISAHFDWTEKRTGHGTGNARAAEQTVIRRSRIFRSEDHDILFAKAEFLLRRSRT